MEIDLKELELFENKLKEKKQLQINNSSSDDKNLDNYDDLDEYLEKLKLDDNKTKNEMKIIKLNADNCNCDNNDEADETGVSLKLNDENILENNKKKISLPLIMIAFTGILFLVNYLKKKDCKKFKIMKYEMKMKI